MNTDLHLDVNAFDPHWVKPIYPGITTIQLEPGPMTGSIRSSTAGRLRISSGWLSRAALYEGGFANDTINVGFILTPDSAAVAHGHMFDAGVISVDLENAAVHEVFPGNVAWVEVSGPSFFMARYIKSIRNHLRPTGHFTLQGPRSQLAPLIDLVEHSVFSQERSNARPQSKLQVRILEAIDRVLASRAQDTDDQQPFVEGDRFRTYVLQAGHQFALEHMETPLALEDICRATGLKRRTLQKYFQEIYGMGPTKYFRTRRLNAVRADLMDTSNPDQQVSAVAERWGFTHMGRFAMYYRRLFGETPSQTAQRRARHVAVG